MTPVGRITWLRPRHVALLAQACFVVLRIRVALWLLPWRRVMAMVEPSRLIGPGVSVDRLERAVRFASRLVPRATCLTQALALNHLLARHGHASTVQIGVRNDDGRFAAHAWVEWSGGPLLSSATELTRYARFFTWPPRVG